MQQLADDVHVAEEVLDYVLGMTQHSRQHRQVYLGASPRAALSLLRASKALALIRARDFVLPDDVKFLAPMVLSHRIVMTPEAELEGIDSGSVIREALERVAYRHPRGV
jgi:MoxR-like ATPase